MQMTKLTPIKEVNWVERPIIKLHDNPPAESQWLYKVWMPDWLAEWDVYANWEKERFVSMAEHLKKGDILFDVGTEVGWCNIIYAQFVGPGNIVLIEPTAEFWPNIKATWQKNFRYIEPLQCHYGLISDRTTGNFVLPRHLFPAEAEGALIDKLAYRYIHEHGLRMPQITIDDFVMRTGIKPDALTIDVEGAEFAVIIGAHNTLTGGNLKVWISIHPELAEKDYGTIPGQLKLLMENMGYKGEYLATDHEEHWLFTKEAKR